MDDDNTLLLVAGGLLVWAIYSGKLGGVGRADQAAASGTPPRPPSRNIAGAIGAAACIGGGAAAGMPALGVAVAPLCSALAPAVARGAVFVGEKTWEGARFVGEKTADVAVFAARNTWSGLKATGNELGTIVRDPLGEATHRTEQSLGILGTTLNYTDRGVDAGYGALPTYLKVAAAPAYAVTKVSVKAADAAVGAGKTVVSGVKKAGNAIESGGKAVANFFGF